MSVSTKIIYSQGILVKINFLGGNQIFESCFFKPVFIVEIERLATSYWEHLLGKLVVLTIINKLSDIKSNVKILSTPLCFLIHLSTSAGIVPDKIKIARIVPFY